MNILAVHQTHDNDWIGAMRWAKENGYKTIAIKEHMPCYNGANLTADMYYSDDPKAQAQYLENGIPQLTL